MLTKEDILKAQEAWGDAIVKIGSVKKDRALCESVTEELLKKLYAFGESEILFKPTMTSLIQFRSTKEGAKSYFIGGSDNFTEDHGFALQPWIEVRFVNNGILLEERRAIAMGNYFFSDLNHNEVKVEFTFGYLLNDKGELKIDLHHSSIPFNG
ncbi:MAG: hypothetical protein K8R35_03930 [Bacteroidales bacterium]|nr:hypothetical protein [Bacteroidales bacterium]